jgi:RNA polymerase sigma factor (sigma-70 family)
VRSDDRTREFELLALPHLHAVHRHATWLAGNAVDAEDVVQEVYLRAFRYFYTYTGGNVRVWLLAILRNTFITWVNVNRNGLLVYRGDASTGDMCDTIETAWGTVELDPETLLIQHLDGELLKRLMQRLPIEYREVLVLREIEDLAYKDIARIIRAPLGTVMSRLMRGRLALRKLWLAEAEAQTGNRAAPAAAHQRSNPLDANRPQSRHTSQSSAHREPVAVGATGRPQADARLAQSMPSLGRRTARAHR